MGEQKVTTMVLKANLKCSKCYRKVKKILCKFPQIRDQVYDEKNDTVTIKVVCCSPEKIKEKIICKGGCCIISIEIKVPEKPKPPPEKPIEKKPKEEEPKSRCCEQCDKGQRDGPCFHGHGWPPPCYQHYWYCRRTVYESYCRGGNYCVSRCDCLCEENPAGCTIM